MRRVTTYGLLLAALVAACSHGGRSGLPPGASSQGVVTPQSVSPGLTKPAPMAQTEILPPSAMQSPVHPNIPVSSLSWSQVPGTASVVAAAPDGSLWVLSDQPAGADKYIWHYASGSWTNISGLASRLTVAQDGSLWALNSGGGIWHYSGGSWSSPGGGASNSITADSSGGIDVLTNSGSGNDRAIWHYTSGSGWAQQSGSGTALAGNFDTNSHTPGSGGSGTINPGGFYILNSAGAIYYENTDKSFAQLPGSASGITPTTNGGVFVLGYPIAQGGNQVYYYDLDNPGYTSESGSGLLSISAATNLYVVSPSNAIYTAALPSGVPAYCSAYSTPSPNANSSPQPVWITDDSNTGAHVVLYVVTGSPPLGGSQTQYLAANGTLQNFTPGATAPPFPLECFPGSTHQGNGLTFQLPPPTNANQSANMYIAYATPPPGGGVPNPLKFVGVGTLGGNSAPTLDWNTPSYASAPWDYVEYTLPNGITDVTQVDKVGLPLQVSQGSTTIGFASGQYENLLSAILADPTYSSLAVSSQLNGRNVLARILSPANAENWGFPQDWWYNSAFNSGHTALSKGYLGYVLSQYQTAPQLYTLNGLNGFSGNYCAKFDGSNNVLFYSVASATTCSSLPGTPISMGIASTLEGTGTMDSYGVCGSAIFQMPYGGAGGPLPTQTGFYLWKAMVIDIARGVALQNGTHPIGGWDTSPSTPVPLSSFYLDPAFNQYAYLVHKNMIGNRSYTLQYDEPGGLAPTFTSNPAQPMQVTIWNVPTYSRATPTVTATPLPCPP